MKYKSSDRYADHLKAVKGVDTHDVPHCDRFAHIYVGMCGEGHFMLQTGAEALADPSAVYVGQGNIYCVAIHPIITSVGDFDPKIGEWEIIGMTHSKLQGRAKGGVVVGKSGVDRNQ